MRTHYRLYIGGYNMIAIESIRLIETRQNLEEFVKPLFCLDGMVSAGFVHEEFEKTITSEHVGILKHLIDSHSDSKLRKGVHVEEMKYIYDTFDCFIKNKTEIIIRMYNLHYPWSQNMRSLILYDVKRQYFSDIDICPLQEGDMANLFKKDLLNIFKYATKITMDYTDYPAVYRVSLLSLLSIIEGSSLKEIILDLGYMDDRRRLSQIYPITKELKEKYKEANFVISDLILNTGPKNERIWCIITSIDYESSMVQGLITEDVKLEQKMDGLAFLLGLDDQHLLDGLDLDGLDDEIVGIDTELEKALLNLQENENNRHYSI